MAATQTTPASPSTRRADQLPWLLRCFWAVVVLLVLTMVGTFSVRTMGYVHGREFSPDLFQRRSFSYFEIPLLHIQITPTRRLDETGRLERFLTSNKHVVIGKPAGTRWDLARSARVSTVVFEGDPQILCRYLDATDSDGKLYWLEWSEKQPELSKKLWPLVALAARKELYTFIPDLMSESKSSADPDLLESRLKKSLAGNLRELAEWQVQQDARATAVEIYDEALRLTPEDPRLVAGRAAAAK